MPALGSLSTCVACWNTAVTMQAEVGLSWHRRHARLAALVLLVVRTRAELLEISVFYGFGCLVKVAWISTRIDVPALT